MIKQLISYIAPGAPATRRVATGEVPFLRPEMGFTPNWYHQNIGIDFGRTWHHDPAYRRQSLMAMRTELKRRFPGTAVGAIHEPDAPLDLLTGTFGACTVSAIYGIPIIYQPDNWPNCAHQYLDDQQIDNLKPPDLDSNPFFRLLLAQVKTIIQLEGTARGFINWQGVLNNAQRLRGEAVFFDLFDNPARIHRLFDCVCTTMIDACQKLQAIQKKIGFEPGFFTVSNCLINMISPDQYRDFILPYDKRIADAFGCIGIHNCAWNATPHLDAYAQVNHLGYIDMGLDSDLQKAKALFPDSRRALMYPPMDLARKEMAVIRDDLNRIAREYGPCDVVVADIEAGTSDEKILEFIHLCGTFS